MLRNGLVQDTRCVGTKKTCNGCPVLVDTVVADAEARDDSASRQGIVERPRVLTIPDDDVPRLEIAYGSSEFLFIIEYAPAFQLDSRRETLFAFAVFLFGHQHYRFCVGHVGQNLPLTPLSAGPYSRSPMPITPAVSGDSRVRRKVLAMTMVLAAITYLDRVAIGVTRPYIARDLGLSPTQMGYVFSAFYLSYALFEIPTGWWGDKVGTRKVLTRIVCWWSAFTVLTGFAFSYSSLLAIRFLFGAGEAGAWPNVARTFSRWFPRRDRGTVQGTFFMGAHLAGGLTPLLATALLAYMDWRTLFGVFGSVGFVWAFVWYRWFRDTPAEHRAVSAVERAFIEDGIGIDQRPLEKTQWKRLLGNRTVVCLCLMYFTQTFGNAFYVTWLPTILASRGLSVATAAILSGLPLTLSVVADLTGGITTDRAARRLGLRLGRISVGGGALTAAGLFTIAAAITNSPVVAALLIALGGAASNFLLGSAWGTCIDIGGRRAGAVSGAMNTSGQVGAILSPILIAFVAQRFANPNASLFLTGVLFLMGAVCWLGVDPTKPVSD
jgi:ACS family glucarate transporter-like MFS transporter